MSDFAFGKNTGSTGRKTNEQLADEVNRGLWGNGDERKRRLAESGYDYNAVQGLVNAQAANVPASGSTDIPSGTLPRQNAGANVPDMGTNISGAQQTAPAAGYDPQANAADFWQRQAQRAQEISGERLSNRRRYGVDLPDDVYEVWNEVISNSENPEEEAHRIGAAYQWSRILGEPLDICYSNLDALNEEYFGSKVTSYKTGFEAVMDMITLGNNNVKIGVLGNQIRDANLAGDTALAESLMNEYRALQQVNEGLQDNIPRSWVTEAFKAGAQSLPFTGYVALSGLFGNFIYPGAGTLTAFNTSAYLTAGQEYMDMLENGSDPFTANIWSIVSGGIQGLIEIQLGNVASALGGGARLMGQEAAKRLTGGAIEKISNTFAKKLHYGATGKMIKNFIARYAGDILEEGAEEALQEITSVIGQEIAASIDGYDIPENDAASIVSRCMEAFKLGVLGAITLGIPTTGLNLVADIREYKNIGTLAGMMDSRETFRSAVKDSPVFEGMGDQQKNGVIDDIFKAAQSKRDERTAAAVSGIKEVNRAAEGFEDITVDEETGESTAAPATRDEEGNLYTADTTIKETDAGRTGRYKIGDASPDADEKNLYGYINYEIDEDSDTVYIRDFVMNFAREGLRQEAYDDFARYMAGYDIQWDTKDSRAASIKETLINNNPNGRNAGLTYYDSVADIADAQTRRRVAEEVAKYMPRVKAQGHLSAAVSLLESMARSQGKNLTTYMFETFGSNIFGEVSDIEQKARKFGGTFEGKTVAQRDNLESVAGATDWKKYENGIRAVIYAGQNADFSTWAHELAHVYRQQIKGDLLSQAEKAFNVKDGDWIHSTVRDADGKLMSSEEAFAYGFQDWLKTGKAPTTQMKNIFQRFAEFLARCYNAIKKHIEISPDIERVYSQMLAADDSVLAKAEQAVAAADRKIRAQEKKAQADAQTRQDQAAQQRADYRNQTVTGEEPEAEKEPARKTEAQRQAEKRDETLERAEQMARESEANADEEYPLTVAEAEEIVAVQDADEARMDDIDGKIEDAVSDKDFFKEQETILNDNDTTQDQVNDVIIDTAGKSFDVKKYSMDVNDIPEDMFFQTAYHGSGAQDVENVKQNEYDPRSLVPNVRGGWTEKKIIKYLKDNPTLSGVVNAIRFIKEFDTPEELKAHMFYHGTAGGSDKLKPSITMSDRDIERYGGGGYGQKYWSISVSKSKKVASNFAPMSDGVRIYPIILAKNAKVIEMPELTDSVELEDHIIDLWNQGVDAVWIGDKDSGEQELSILNPRAVVNIGRADWYKNYALGTEKNPINIKDDEQIKEMFDYAKNYERKTDFLHSIGYAGIKYPAGTIYGNGNGAYNYVIFNDEDARIVDHLLFQTEQELYDDAAMFDTWQDFMEAYETSFDPYAMERDDYHSQVPDNADASWYKATWELAHGLKPQESIDQEQVWKEYQEDSGLEKHKDFDFLQKIRQPGELEKFLIRVQQIMDIDLDSPEWRSLDEEDAAERSRIDEMQRYISTQLKHGTWLTNAIRLSKGKPLTNQKRSEMQTLIFSSLRDYRAVYAQVMEDEELAVPEDQTVSAQLRKRLADPDEDFEQMSPERRRQIAEDLSNQEVAARISSGEIKLDSELDGYIKSLKKDIRELSKKAADLQEEVNEDYRRISDAEQRELLRLHEKLLRAKVNYGRSSDTTGRRIRRGLQTTQSYEFERKTLRADYDTIFRQFADLKNVIMITAQVTEAMRHQAQLADMREALRVKQQDNTALQELKKLRVQLVKRTMRRVPFARIDYDSGRLLVAIQRIFEPNLMGGVNEWIGQAAADSRAVASAWLTDIDEREKIEKILEKRGTEASSKMLRMLRDLKSIDDYNKWSNADKKRLSRVMPKEDWIRDLALEELAKEREESIDLDIKVDEVTRTVRNPKTGEKEDQVRYVIRMPDELAQEVKDALGANLYNDLINKPFSEWTTGELESLAIRVNEIYTDGRDTLAAKRQVKAEEARAIRAEIEAVIRNTGIQINDDDTPEEKKKKLEKIDKILGNNPDMKGSSAAKKETRLNRILHGYADANVRRIARMLDGYEDGINTQELYFKEDECWNSREREKERRAAAVQDVMKKYNLTSLDLNRTVEIEGMNGLALTVDDLLYIYAADKDYDVVRDSKGNPILDEDGNEQNDDYAPTSRNAVMFGNMLSADENLARKQEWEQMDRELSEAIEGKELTAEQLQELTAGILDRHPGTSAFIAESKKRYSRVLAAATELINGNEGLRALYEVISKDYADEFPRMNRVSIEEFNQPVNRIRNYVPLIRLESNGETNANQVKQDLLTTAGGNAAGKIGVNKGMTQRRVSISPLHQKPVQTGLYKTWLGAVDRTEHFIAYAPYVRELNRVYKGRDAEYTRRFIESRYGRGMLSYLDDYINEVANPNANKVRTAGDDLVRTLRGKTAPAYLAWKLSGVLKQAATSPAPYFQFVSPLEYISAAWECTTNHGYDTIKEKSLFMRSRVQDPVYDLVKELEETAKTPFEQKFMKAQELGMKGLEWIDWACVAPGWLACYKKEYARLTNGNAGAYDRKKAELQAEQRSNDGTKPVMTAEQIEKASQDAVLTDAEIDSLAVRYADDCTRQCQPSSRSTDLAPLYKNSSEFAKAYLQFQTSLNVIWQNIRYDLPYAVRTKQFKRAAGMVAGYVMAGVAMNALMDGVTSGGKDDDDDKLTALRNIIFYSTTQFTDSVPLIGSYLTTVTQKAITGKSSYLTTGTDMTPMITKLGSAMTSFSNGNWSKGAGYFAEGVGLALGLPTSGVKEIYKFFTDEKGNFDIGLGNIYGIVGDFIKE